MKTASFISRRGLLQLAAAAGVVPVLAANAPRIAAQEEVVVSIVDFAFQPAGTTIPVGATVTWTNTGSSPHTVTADDGSFGSEVLASGASFSHTFTASGAVSYRCLLHPMMTGTVIAGDGM